MRPSFIGTLYVLVCSSVFMFISSASMLLDDDKAVEFPSPLSENLEIGRPPPPVPPKSVPPSTRDSAIDRACVALLAAIAVDPTLLSGLLPDRVVQALVRFARIAFDPSPYAHVPPRDLLSLLDDVPPPSVDDRCGPWRYEPSGYFVRDCRRVGIDTPLTQPSVSGSRYRPSRGQQLFGSGFRAGGRQRPSSLRVLPASFEPTKKPKSFLAK